MKRSRRLFAVVTVLGLVLMACGSSDNDGDNAGMTTTAPGGDDEFVVAVANYELLAGAEQRFIAGLAVRSKGTVVSYGSIDLTFAYLGTKEKPIDPPQTKFSAEAEFLPVASADGSTPPQTQSKTEPQVVRPSEALGVYRAQPVRFDAPGYWAVKASTKLGGKAVEADAAFEVFAEPRVPAPGRPAPRTAGPIAGAPGVAPEAIDSRASDGEPIPDIELHSTTVVSAIELRRPLVVVVSTPVFCVSKFCGPITDAVSAVAKRYAGRVEFVHLEVWEDFEAKKLSPWAAEWIKLPNGDANEPWVFTVGRDGMVVERFDNVIGNAELDAAVARIAG